MKRLSQVFLAIVLAMSVTGCGNQSGQSVNSQVSQVKDDQAVNESSIEGQQEAETAYPVTITNYNYSKEHIPVTFEKAPEKVFCLYQNSIEIMLALGLEEHIVAAAGLDHPVKEEYQEAFEKVNYLSDFELTKESVIMLEPDFILSWMSPFNEKKLGDVDFWHERGINTYMAPNSNSLEANRTLENEYKYILEVGQIFDVNERAQGLVDEIKDQVEVVKEKTEGKEAERILIMEFLGDNITVYGKDSLGGDMVSALGGEVLEGAEKGIGLEDLINLDPDAIFVVYMDETGEDEGAAQVSEVTENPALASLKAVQNGRVYAMPLGEMYAAGIRSKDGVSRFAKGMYPELEVE